MSEHNIKHEETQEALRKLLAELHARMEEAKARVSLLKSRQRYVTLEKEEEADLDASEAEIRDVISAIDSERRTDWTSILPDELLMNIVHYVPSKYLYWLGRVDRRWNKLMNQPPMLKLERSLRWTSNHLKQLKAYIYLPDMIVNKMLYDEDKLYVYVVKKIVHDDDKAREIETKQIDIVSSEGTITISDEAMTGEFTVHKGVVYYAVEEEGGLNKVKKHGTSAVSSSYNGILSMVVHGDHLFLATQRCLVCALDCLELTHMYTIGSQNLLVKLISCNDQVLGLELGSSTRIHTYEIRDEKLIKGYHPFDADGMKFSNGSTARIIDMACTESGDVCVYLESSLGRGEVFSQIALVNDRTLLSNEVTLFNPGLRHRPCGMGVRGDYVYVNTISGDFGLVNLKTMRCVVYPMGEDYKCSSVILMTDHSLLALLTRQQQVVRFYWDGHIIKDGSA